MNKKVIGSLLGGGVASIIASLGGLKLNDHINYTKKVNYYSKWSENVSLRAPEEFKKEGYYLPNWENDALWSSWHKKSSAVKEHNQGEIFKRKHPTPKAFRDYCYEAAKRDKNFINCNNSDGWCPECLRSKSWDTA